MNTTNKHIAFEPVPSKLVKGSPIFMVGNAPTIENIREGVPFSGDGGKEHVFHKMLGMAGIDFEKCSAGNVFLNKAQRDRVDLFFAKKLEAKKIKAEQGWEPKFGPLGNWGVCRPEKEADVERLWAEIDEVQPRLLVAFGTEALWALTGESNIAMYRGTVMESREIGGRVYKVLPANHPDAVVRGWNMRATFVSDLLKAKRESKSADFLRKVREIWIRPGLEDIKRFFEIHVEPIRGTPTPLSYDIETADGMITCIGFSPNDTVSLCIPFWDREHANYWATQKEEVKAWGYVKEVLEDPDFVKLAHNTSYDATWLLKRLGIVVGGRWEDTMHMHHALQPEMKKSLGYLASIYTDEIAWKSLVKFSKTKKADA